MRSACCRSWTGPESWTHGTAPGPLCLAASWSASKPVALCATVADEVLRLAAGSVSLHCCGLNCTSQHVLLYYPQRTHTRLPPKTCMHTHQTSMIWWACRAVHVCLDHVGPPPLSQVSERPVLAEARAFIQYFSLVDDSKGALSLSD